MAYCGSCTLVKCADDAYEGKILRCRSWGCPDCQPKRQAQLQMLAADGAPNRFITLTMRQGQHDTIEKQASALADCWRIIVKRAKRKYKMRSLEYIAIFEAHKSGWPHLHILARCGWISQKWLSEQMVQLCNSSRQDIRQVRSAKQAAFYVAKYVGKAPGKFGTSKRYWNTRNWRVRRKDWSKAFSFHFRFVERRSKPLHEIVRQLERNSWQAWWISDDKALILSPRWAVPDG